MITLPNGHVVPSYTNASGGISDYPKNAADNEYAFGRSIDHRTDPYQITILPKTAKESGSVILGLIKDGDLVNTDTYLYDDLGNIYKRTSAGSHSLVRSVASSSGNGMVYYTEDGYLYYTTDKGIGRYGQIGGSTPTWVDDFLIAQGGVPLNTNCLDLESGSTQYASRADTASLSITGDLAIEAYVKFESLPTAGNSMVIASKWDIDSNKRSYKFEIYAASGYFGDGGDGALTISSNTTEAPIDSACTGTIATTSLSATNINFAAGQKILIHQTQGTGAGTWQKNEIASYTAGTITLTTALNATYGTGAQVRVLKEYTNVTINSGITYTAKAWNGTVGGILAFLANGTITVTGSISAAGKGYRGGAGGGGTASATQGEGTTGTGTTSTAANGTGGGGGANCTGAPSYALGGGGGYATVGTTGEVFGLSGTGGTYGGTIGGADLNASLFFGGGGGGEVERDGSGSLTAGAAGGNGGGIVFIAGTTVTVSGSITANGAAGSIGDGGVAAGSGAGGAVFIKCGGVATLGTTLITATGATGAGNGRVHLDYYTSYTGTTSPTLNYAQDNSLLTNITYQLRLGLSSDGTAEEYLQRNSTIVTGTYFHLAVSWDASAHEAEFMQDAVSLGTMSGAVTSLNDNASKFGVGADFNGATPRSLLDGLIDDVRVWNTERTVTQIYNNKDVEINAGTAGLVAYYQFDATADDSTSNANNLTLSGSPSYSTDVPFASPTTRQDLDQSLDTSGQVFALATSISEAAGSKQSFVPNKDPQKSVEINISDTGDDSDWTLTVHDSLNRVIASKTYTHAELRTGDFEFTFDDVWRPIIGATYHFHLTATTTTGAPAVVTTTNADLDTADFHTYYQILVEDDYHPITQFLNFTVIGNERYVAKYAADGTYEPHKLVFPSGWRVRCFAFWRNYIVIGFWKGTNIYDTDQGAFALWDGKSDTYNEFYYLPEGAVNAMLGAKGVLYIWAGYHGDMLEYRGGDYAIIKKSVPKMANDKYIEIFPKAVSMWDGLIRWGIAGNSDSAVVERGVYTWGTKDEKIAESLTYDLPISTGNRAATNIQIGFVFPVEKKLLIGWKDNVSYGVDVVDPTGNPFTTATIEKDIKDYGAVWKEKNALLLRADFEPLLTGESVKLKYRLDRATNWTEGATDNESGYAQTAGDTYARLNIPNGNYKELEIACDLATSVSTSPTLLSLAPEIDPKKNEGIV